jgi:hypothetical protein
MVVDIGASGHFDAPDFKVTRRGWRLFSAAYLDLSTMN